MGNVTLTVDCGGTGIKASVFDQHSKVLVDFPYLTTPYPMSPNVNTVSRPTPVITAAA